MLGSQLERAGARHHAERLQPRPEAERGVAAVHLDGHRAGARARVVRRVVLVLVDVVDVQPADQERSEDHQQRDPRGQAADRAAAPAGAAVVVPAAPAPRAAGAVTATAPAATTRTVLHVLVPGVAAGLALAEAGEEARVAAGVAAAPALLAARGALAVPGVAAALVAAARGRVTRVALARISLTWVAVGRTARRRAARVARGARVVPALLPPRVRAGPRPALAGVVRLLLGVSRPALLRVGVAPCVPPRAARLTRLLGPWIRLPALLAVALVTPLRRAVSLAGCLRLAVAPRVVVLTVPLRSVSLVARLLLAGARARTLGAA